MWRTTQEQKLLEKLDLASEAETLAANHGKREKDNNGEETTTQIGVDRDQIEILARQDLNVLAALAMPTVFEYAFPTVLLAAWQFLTTYVVKFRDFSKLALGIPRGHGKTTLVKLFILFCILFTKKRFILIISSTAQHAENIMADVFDMLSEPNIVQVFGDWRLGIADKNTNELKKFGFRGRDIIVAAIGQGGSIRGFNLKNERPDVMVFDDIQTKEASESEVQTEAIKRWMYGTAMKAKSPRGCLYIFCGNMYPGPNSILKQLKDNPGWIKFISGAILNDSTALWEELYPLAQLLEDLDHDIATGHPEIFFAEVMNDTEAGINTRVDLSKIQYWKFTEMDLPQGKFILIDPSTGKGLDNTGIGYIEVYDGMPGLRELIDENLSPRNTILKALALALRTGARCIVIEGTGYQSTLAYWFNEVCEELGVIGIVCLEIYRNQQSKNASIASTIKALCANEIFIHDTVRSQVMSEISNWNPMKRDNRDQILDILDYAPRAIQKYGPMFETISMTLLQISRGDGVVENNHAF